MSATYRLQFQPGFGFREAAHAVPYLAALGVSTLYASPLFAARRGSVHGYDVVDPTRLNPELGTREEFDALVRTLREHGLRLLLDIVPNHMATGEQNRWLMDVYRHGRDSEFARFFDIDWATGGGRVMVPILGAPLEEALTDIKLEDDHVVYFEHRLPLRPGTHMSFDVLEVLEQQHYRLTWWREANRGLNYRRFFDVSELISVRQEEQRAFERTHSLLKELAAAGLVDAVRIDHVDGLHDPGGYLQALRRATGERPLYVEKILGPHERLPAEWPVAGTTGYEFIRALDDVSVDPAGWQRLVEIAARYTGDARSFGEILHDAKRLVVRDLFAGEVGSLARALRAGAPADEVASAIEEVVACFPVYRTYIRSGKRLQPADRAVIAQALREAERRMPASGAMRAVARALRHPGEHMRFVARLQQLTGPAMAKGFEDTALYRYMPLVSRNEVGGEPGSPPHGPDAFHRFCAARLREFPATMNATSTHDTKRGEDVRARLDVLSEIPEVWARTLRRLARLAAGHKVDGMPDATDELLVYQTLLGAWPIDAGRLDTYLTKAAREAKRRTNWLDPDERYEEALLSFGRALLDDEAFLRAIEPLRRRLALHGAANSLAHLVLKATAPGVPDFYQGTELWWLVLVDPDNRPPLDLGARAQTLSSVERARPAELLRSWEDGRVKAFVTHRALRFRREHEELFERGAYVPLRAEGPRADNVVAFARRRHGAWALVVVPRLTTQLGRRLVARRAWEGTTLALPSGAPQEWTDVFTGRTARTPLPLNEVLGRFPVALLGGGATGFRTSPRRTR